MDLGRNAMSDNEQGALYAVDAWEKIVNNRLIPGDLVCTKKEIGIFLGENDWLVKTRDLSFAREQKWIPKRRHLMGVAQLREEASVPMMVEYFRANSERMRLCELGLVSITNGNHSIFGPISVMPDTRLENQESNFSDQWDTLMARVQPGDILFTRQTDSWQSGFIASIDDGSWSHCMVCGPNGLTRGMNVNGPETIKIDELRSRKVRVGLYRNFKAKEKDPAGVLVWLNQMQLARPNARYNFVGAFMAGVRAKLGILSGPPTPNGLIYRGNLRPIAMA